MRRRILLLTAAIGALILGLMVASLPDALRAQSGLISAQVLSNTVYNGASARGAGVLQTGQVSTLSTTLADTTPLLAVAAPTSGKIYVRGIWVEKSTTDTGSVTLTYGTQTTDPCDTDTGTLITLGAATGQVLKFGYTPLGIQVPVAANQLCAATDAATTVVRVLAQ